jgi:hypothetical protein
VAVDDSVGVGPGGVDVFNDVGAGMVGALFALAADGFHVVLHRVLDIAIDFPGGAFYLVDDAFIGELLIAYGFANCLLDLSLDLIEFPAYLIGIHEYVPSVKTTVNDRADTEHGAPVTALNYRSSAAN